MGLILKRLVVWLFEALFEALLLGSVLISLFGYDQHAFGKDLLIYADAILLMFFGTCYLLSTAIFRAAWRGQGLWSYPVVATVLFFIHFEILNIGIGGAFDQAQRPRILAAGMSIAFACTLTGSYVLRRWVGRSETALMTMEPS